MSVLFFLGIVLLVIAEGNISFFPHRAQGGVIFHRPSIAAEDIFNGHAKPKAKPEITLISMANISEADTDSLRKITSEKHPVAVTTAGPEHSSGHTEPPPYSAPVFVTKSPAGSKYFVTWRPRRPDSETRDPANIIITVRNTPPTRHDSYKPQHFFSQFSHSPPTSTLPPFLLETSISLNTPSSTPAPPTRPWSYIPVFNPIFEFKTTTKSTSQYAITHKFRKKTSTKRPSYRPKRRRTTTKTTSTSTTATTNTAVRLSTSTTLPPADELSLEEPLKSPFLSKFSLNQTHSDGTQQLSQTFSTGTEVEDEDTITKNPTTFLAYIRFLISTFLR